MPEANARTEIITDTLNLLGTVWPRVADLTQHIGSFVAASEGLDGRQLRKAIITAAGTSVETASDLNLLRAEHVLNTLEAIVKTRATMEAA